MLLDIVAFAPRKILHAFSNLIDREFRWFQFEERNPEWDAHNRAAFEGTLLRVSRRVQGSLSSANGQIGDVNELIQGDLSSSTLYAEFSAAVFAQAWPDLNNETHFRSGLA